MFISRCLRNCIELLFMWYTYTCFNSYSAVLCNGFTQVFKLVLTEYCYLIEQVSVGYGTVTAYALLSLEPRGTLFVSPGMEVGAIPSLAHVLYVVRLHSDHKGWSDSETWESVHNLNYFINFSSCVCLYCLCKFLVLLYILPVIPFVLWFTGLWWNDCWRTFTRSRSWCKMNF